MSKEEKKVTITWSSSHKYSESTVRMIADSPTWGDDKFAEACKAWVEANPEKKPLPNEAFRLLRALRLGSTKNSVGLIGGREEMFDFLGWQYGVSERTAKKVQAGDYDEELGLTEIIRLLGEL